MDGNRRVSLGVLLGAILVLGGLCLLGGNSPPGSLATAPGAPRPRGLLARPSPIPACTPTWQVVDSPNPGVVTSYLFGVDAVSATDAWAVGSYDQPNGQLYPLIEHWDGFHWNLSPVPHLLDDTLMGVAARTSADAWAVGYAESANLAAQTLIEHWGGTAWQILPSPNPTSDSQLRGVAAFAADDVWAVGYYCCVGFASQTLIEHWDGTAWSVVPSPNLGTESNQLYSVAGVTPDDIWAVGLSVDVVAQTFILHWDGQQWQPVASPHPGPAEHLYGVTALAPDDAWAVGDYNANGSATLVLHWDGQSWQQTASPNPEQTNVLFAVSGLARDDAWAVGYTSGTTPGETLALHWDGQSWTRVPSPNPGTSANDFNALAARPGDAVWAVGDQWNGGPWLTLIETYACPIPSPTPTSTPTIPPPPATGTPATAPSPTRPLATVTSTPYRPTATATPCTIPFSDVHPTDYFYGPVQYLACHGVIGGYADGTFRPYADTTRAQMVKMVVLGFGLPLTTPPAPHYSFADVPPSQPFFAVIETAGAHRIVTGYTCGGPGEPCDDQQRPYFRPNANVTRGQLAKIAVVAAGWMLLNPTRPTFSDVPMGSVFYPFVETVVCHGVVSGYGDGTFRPFNDATRGQIAKIVYLSITDPPGSCGGPVSK